MDIKLINAEEARALLPELIALLTDAVDSGASVGFLPPLTVDQARRYWEKRIGLVEAGEVLLFIARIDGQVAGTAQLGLTPWMSGKHRAEVQKVLTHNTFRRRGVGKALMQALEDEARARGLTLLVLDTRHGDVAEQLYQGMGYQAAGVIPDWAQNGNGDLDATVFYYKILR